MFYPIGGDMAVRSSTLVAIFDLDNASTSKRTREFLAKAEREGQVVPCDELPKTFLITQEFGMDRVYLSSLTYQTLAGRARSQSVR